jgi:hypothetical protein
MGDIHRHHAKVQNDVDGETETRGCVCVVKGGLPFQLSLEVTLHSEKKTVGRPQRQTTFIHNLMRRCIGHMYVHVGTFRLRLTV